MIILILLIIVLVFMMSISFIYYDTADRFSKNKEMYALLGFTLPIMPILLFTMVMSISNLTLGYFPKVDIGETAVFISLVGYSFFVFMLPQFMRAKWKRSNNYNSSFSNQGTTTEQREPTYRTYEHRREEGF